MTPQELPTSVESLRLARLSVDDAGELHDLIQTNATHVTQNGDYGDMVVRDQNDIRDLIAHQDNEFLYGINYRSRLIGSVSLIHHRPGVYGIGYWISSDYTGRGYVTACCQSLIDAARQIGATEVWAGITHGNDASVAVVKKLGFSLVRDQPSHLSFMMRLNG